MVKRIFKRLIYVIRVIIIKIINFKSLKLSKNIHKVSFKSIKDIDIVNGKIKIFGSAKFSRNTQIGVRNGGEITIKNDFFSNNNFTCISHGKIEFGEKVSIGPNVCIYDHDHFFDENGKISKKYRVGTIKIGNNVWIGAGVIVLRDTVIGDNSIIGAGTIVKGNIPPNSLVTSNREMNINKLRKK